MKKLMLLLSTLPFLLASCNDGSKTTINGNFSDSSLDGQKVYYYALNIDSLNTNGPILKDSADIVSGKFTLTATISENPSLGLIGLSAENRKPENPADVFVVLEPGTVSITLNKQRVTVGGTPRNEALNTALYSVLNETIDLRDEVEAAGGVEAVPLDKNGENVATRMKKKSKEMEKGLYAFVKDNMKNRVGEVLFLAMGQSFKEDQLLELIEMSDSTFQNKESIKQLKEFIDFRKQSEAAVIGTQYKDISLLNKKGGKENLSQHVGKGKYIFLDFWATSCRPCLEEMPGLMAVYEKYKGKDFDIIGISLDQNKNAWEQGYTLMNLQWTQLFDADQIAGKTYEISSIPYTLLIDREGKIIAMNLSADNLDDKLSEILK